MRVTNNATILVVDDDPQFRRTLRLTLSGHGYAVMEAKNDPEAVEAVVRKSPNLILPDVNMPGMTGLEVCRNIRPCFAGPIIMITVRNAEADKIAGLDSGTDDYMVKPFAGPGLLNRVIGGWTLNTTGQWLTPTMPPADDQSNTDMIARSTGGAIARPDCVGNAYANQSNQHFFNLSAFALPPVDAGRFGTCGVGIL